jgi:phosphate transport system permease protein
VPSVTQTSVDERRAPEPAEPRRRLASRPTPGDVAFRGLLAAGAVVVLGIMVLVGAFLAVRALDALRSAGWSFFTTAEWDPDGGRFGIAAVLVGTVLIGLTAVVVALPLALGTALYIAEYAPVTLRRTLINLVDLMAAVPSIVYGLWGFFLLQPEILVVGPTGNGLPRWLATYFGWIPLFRVQEDGKPFDPRDPLVSGTIFSSSTFIAGLVVAMMVAPIACSVMRESFSQAPLGEREGAYALGSTKWGMIRTVVLPFGLGGIIGGSMLGLGRARGATIAVFMVISVGFAVQPHILESGSSSVSSLIALKYGEATAFATSALMAAGLALFVMTLIVNFAASAAIARSRSGAVSDG